MVQLFRSMINKVLPQNQFGISSTDHLKENPMVGYLNLYQNQHRLIFILYCSLILSFTAFLILVSIFTFYSLDNALIPSWGLYILGGIDFVLFFGTIQGFRQLKHYRQKSQKILGQIYENLQADLTYFHKIKSLSDKGYPLTTKGKKKLIIDHSGWDYAICPECNSKMEMLLKECPNCHHEMQKTLLS